MPPSEPGPGVAAGPADGDLRQGAGRRRPERGGRRPRRRRRTRPPTTLHSSQVDGPTLPPPTSRTASQSVSPATELQASSVDHPDAQEREQADEHDEDAGDPRGGASRARPPTSHRCRAGTSSRAACGLRDPERHGCRPGHRHHGDAGRVGDEARALRRGRTGCRARSAAAGRARQGQAPARAPRARRGRCRRTRRRALRRRRGYPGDQPGATQQDRRGCSEGERHRGGQRPPSPAPDRLATTARPRDRIDDHHEDAATAARRDEQPHRPGGQDLALRDDRAGGWLGDRPGRCPAP